MVATAMELEYARQYRERKYAEYAAMPPIPCECGCGTMIPPVNKLGKPAHYKRGHQSGGEATRFKSGHGTWNRGIPNPELSERMRGQQKSPEALAKRTETRRANGGYAAWNKGKAHPMKNQAGVPSSIGGVRPDLGIYVRSRWEANYARYLNSLGQTFLYEPGVFQIRLPDGSEHAYRPDFLVDGSFFVEIKGWDRVPHGKALLDAASTQLPLPLLVIRKTEYLRLEENLGNQIPGWEFRGDPLPPMPRRLCRNANCGRVLVDKPKQQIYCSPECYPKRGMQGMHHTAETLERIGNTRRANNGGLWFTPEQQRALIEGRHKSACVPNQ